MRAFFYRMSWDKEFKKRTLIISGLSLCALALCIGIFPVVRNVSANMEAQKLAEQEQREREEAENNKGDEYSLEFNKPIEEKNNSSNEQNNNNDSSETNDNGNTSNTDNTSSSGNSSDSGSSSSGDSGGGGSVVSHTHSWFTVVDQAAYTETRQVQVGSGYRCNNCGFYTTDAGAISSHCSANSHSFSSTPIYESRQIFHEAVTHEQCSCGARR